MIKQRRVVALAFQHASIDNLKEYRRVEAVRAKCFSQFRRSLDADFDAVSDSYEPLIVTRRGRASFVVIPISMYDNWQDTLKSSHGPSDSSSENAD